jgi:hypothetical protein
MSILDWDNQIYLLYYWMRTNLISFENPTIEQIKEQLHIEFGITGEIDQIATEIKELFDLDNE